MYSLGGIKIPRIKLCGAYTITHVASGGVYIGSTQDLRLREMQHRWTLRKNRHRNPKLQAAFNSDPRLEFFHVITETREEAYDFEQQMLNHHKDNPLLFNVALDARNPASNPTLYSSESREKQRLKLLGRKPSAETRAKWVAQRTGLKARPETRAKMSAAGKKVDKTICINNLLRSSLKRRKPIIAGGAQYPSIKDACRAFNLTISAVLNRCRHQTKYQDWYFISPEKE